MKQVIVPDIPSAIPTVPLKYHVWRQHQREAVSWLAGILQKWPAAALDAPCGSGKSLLGMAIAGLLEYQTIYVTGTRQLQSQVAQDFPDAVTIWGREHFPCLWHPNLSASDCLHDSKSEEEEDHCPQIGECPYLAQKRAALAAQVACLSYAYLLTEANYVGGFHRLSREGHCRPTLAILDEGDTAADELCRFVSIVITQKQLERCGIQPPKHVTKPDSWREWAGPAAESVAAVARGIKHQASRWRGDVPQELVRLHKSYDKLAKKLREFAVQVDDNWVYELDTPGRWEFKPVWVDGFGKMLTGHADHTLGMSATMLSAGIWARDLGIDPRTTCFRQIPSTFPAERRPFRCIPVADFSRKEMTEESLRKMVQVLDSIIEEHPDEKGVIHAISYATAEYIRKHSRNAERIVTHENGAGRMDSLKEHTNEGRPTILLSPSFTRGLDLPGDLATWQVICRLPWLSLGDKQTMKKRWSGKAGDEWYKMECVRNIVQASGRIVRSAEDYGETVILDARWERFYSENKDSFPKWFREAVV